MAKKFKPKGPRGGRKGKDWGPGINYIGQVIGYMYHSANTRAKQIRAAARKGKDANERTNLAVKEMFGPNAGWKGVGHSIGVVSKELGRQAKAKLKKGFDPKTWGFNVKPKGKQKPTRPAGRKQNDYRGEFGTAANYLKHAKTVHKTNTRLTRRGKTHDSSKQANKPGLPGWKRPETRSSRGTKIRSK